MSTLTHDMAYKQIMEAVRELQAQGYDVQPPTYLEITISK
jgi:hypothetical protein